MPGDGHIRDSYIPGRPDVNLRNYCIRRDHYTLGRPDINPRNYHASRFRHLMFYPEARKQWIRSEEAERVFGSDEIGIPASEHEATIVSNASGRTTSNFETLPPDVRERVEARSKLEDGLDAIEKQLKKTQSYDALCNRLESRGYKVLAKVWPEGLNPAEIESSVQEGRKCLENGAEDSQSLLKKVKDLDTLGEKLSSKSQGFEQYLNAFGRFELKKFQIERDKKKHEIEQIQDCQRDLETNPTIPMPRGKIQDMVQFWSERGINLTFDSNKGITLSNQDTSPTDPPSQELYKIISDRKYWDLGTLRECCSKLVSDYSEQLKQSSLSQEQQNTLGTEKEKCENQSDLLTYYGERVKFYRKLLIARQKTFDILSKNLRNLGEFEKCDARCRTLSEEISTYLQEIDAQGGDSSALVPLKKSLIEPMESENLKDVARLSEEFDQKRDDLDQSLVKATQELGEQDQPFFFRHRILDDSDIPSSLVHLKQEAHGDCGAVCAQMVLGTKNKKYIEGDEAKNFVRDYRSRHQQVCPEFDVEKEVGTLPKAVPKILKEFKHPIDYQFKVDLSPDELEDAIGKSDEQGDILPVVATVVRNGVLNWEESLMVHGIVPYRVSIDSTEEKYVAIVDPAYSHPYEAPWEEFLYRCKGRYTKKGTANIPVYEVKPPLPSKVL